MKYTILLVDTAEIFASSRKCKTVLMHQARHQSLIDRRTSAGYIRL